MTVQVESRDALEALYATLPPATSSGRSERASAQPDPGWRCPPRPRPRRRRGRFQPGRSRARRMCVDILLGQRLPGDDHIRQRCAHDADGSRAIAVAIPGLRGPGAQNRRSPRDRPRRFLEADVPTATPPASDVAVQRLTRPGVELRRYHAASRRRRQLEGHATVPSLSMRYKSASRLNGHLP